MDPSDARQPASTVSTKVKNLVTATDRKVLMPVSIEIPNGKSRFHSQSREIEIQGIRISRGVPQKNRERGRITKAQGIHGRTVIDLVLQKILIPSNGQHTFHHHSE